MAKRKPKYIPGLGAVVSQRVTRTLRENRLMAAECFTDMAELAREYYPDRWAKFPAVVRLREAYNRAALADTYKPLA